MIFSGITLGLALLARETHIMLPPMMLIILFIRNHSLKDKNIKSVFYKTLGTFCIAFLTFFLFWPMPFFHLEWEFNYFMNLRVNAARSIPEVFFGRLMLTPIPYYFVYFIITTPLIILLFALIGAIKINRSRNWIWYSLILWFCIPFIMSFYPKREHGIRYIIQIMIPFALIAAMGFEAVVIKLVKKINYKILFLIPLFIYQFIILLRITPYYIDYFNIVVGGPKNVYEKKLFQLGWWGEGGKEAGKYLKAIAFSGSTVGVAHEPFGSIPKIKNLIMEEYQENKTYDYVIVNFYNIIREGFNDSKIRKNYKVIYSVIADGAHLVEVYKRK